MADIISVINLAFFLFGKDIIIIFIVLIIAIIRHKSSQHFFYLNILKIFHTIAFSSILNLS